VQFKKSIWLIYNVFLAMGLVYLVATAYSRWEQIRQDAAVELAYLNRIFASSMTLNFDQQEIMLDLLGRQILADQSAQSKIRTQRLLDKILQQNNSLLAFGLANMDGDIVVSSSNLDLDKMPNLKELENSRKSFDKAAHIERMVLGRTYFLAALDDLVIPIRKGIRDDDNQVIGIMTAGIKPRELIPRLDSMNQESGARAPYQLQVFHDYDFYYAYVSGIADKSMLRKVIDEPMSMRHIEMLEKSLEAQLGLSLETLREDTAPVVFSAEGSDGRINLYSIVYLPKYQMWSSTLLPRDFLLGQFFKSVVFYVITFCIIFGLAFWMFRRIAAFEQKNHQLLVDQASQDFLTGLKNRQFLRLAESQWIHARAEPFSVFFIDLDNFKNINDSHGHSYGDNLLKQVAGRLLSMAGKTDLVCRQGGDEFIVLSRRCDETSIASLANAVLKAIAAPYYVEQYNFVLGASIGVARFPEDGASFEELFSAADTAMYQAKNVKNSFNIFSRELREQLMETTYIQHALPQALSDGEFSLVYQPQVADSKSPVGVEALIRWQHSEKGMIPPDRFIPVSEGNGMIIDIGHYVIDQALKDLSLITDSHRCTSLLLSVNVSIRQLQENGFVDKLAASLSACNFPAQQLTLEITEGIFIDDLQYLIPVLNQIRDLGVKISLDDFGTGYSSLSLLKQLPIDELKIDKSFIDNITTSDEDRLMVLNIIDIAQNLGIQVVAEGIESKEQSRMLIELGCNLQQGYYFCKPVKLEQLIEYCDQTNWTFDKDDEDE
jgi:diguanylate cyclase (GGDEF)-like protein